MWLRAKNTLLSVSAELNEENNDKRTKVNGITITKFSKTTIILLPVSKTNRNKRKTTNSIAQI